MAQRWEAFRSLIGVWANRRRHVDVSLRTWYTRGAGPEINWARDSAQSVQVRGYYLLCVRGDVSRSGAPRKPNSNSAPAHRHGMPRQRRRGRGTRHAGSTGDDARKKSRDLDRERPTGAWCAGIAARDYWICSHYARGALSEDALDCGPRQNHTGERENPSPTTANAAFVLLKGT